jgi:PEP-CTERM motif
LCVFPSALHAFNAIGFEGNELHGIPNLPTTGVPTGVTSSTFNYTLKTGNNLQTFRNAGAGTVDSDDVLPGTTGSGSVPDYFKAPEFGWILQGYVNTSLTTANWNAFQSDATGASAPQGTDFPGAQSGQTTELGEAFNVNRFFSPAQGNLAAAPGLGDQFLDVWNAGGTPGVAAQMSIDITATQNTLWTGTFGFGGRDLLSDQANSFFRLRDGATVLFSGSTGDVPFEYWTDSNVQGSVSASNGVTQTDWEYFKFSDISVTAGKVYTVDVIMPEEQNFDWVLGAAYTVLPGAQVPEPSSLLLGVATALGLLVRRRRI